MKGAKATKPAAKDGNEASTQRTPEAAAPPEQTPGLTPSHLHRLQRMAGNAAVSRLVAQRYTAPVKPPPSQAPGFRKVQSDVAAKKQKLSQHNPAASESQSAQDAAVAPPDDKEAQGKAANAEKMNDAKPGEFNKAAFIEAVNKAIADQAPKNLDEADKFSGSGKAEKIKGEVDGKVTDGKKASSKDIETTTKAAPDTSQAKEKEVTPMKPDQPPANPGAPNAADATPQQQPPEVTDFSEGPKKTDQQMADAEVTEEQLAKSNEPEFTDALGEKKKAEQHSAQAPAQARGAEKQQLATAKSNAAAAGTQAMSALTATRAGAGKQVDGGKGETKSKDEQKREQVTAKLQKVFDATQKDVEGILSGLDGKVDKQFEEGEKKARDAFNKDQKRRMKQYKDKRYGGFWGPAKWAKDKIAGMPEEANQLFQESRKLYVNMMQGVISSIADTIGAELGKAKARIAQGRADIKTEVDKLPADLKQYGQEAAKDFAGKFDDLESEVNEKSQQLVQTLAQKYTQALNAVDEEIKKLQEANKGLVQKAVDAVVGVIKTIKELKDLLMGILAKAASAIMKIIKDPIGFLGNLVRAVGAGLQQFISNIGTHLQTGLVSWLLGTSAKAGLEIPAKFDLKGIIQLIASLLGLTWANIRARITRQGVPDQAMNAAEQSVPVAKALATEGPAGAAKEITAETGDLKSTILDDLKSYLIPTVIIAGITWILSLLNPASAFVRAVKGIIDIVSFIVNQGAQIVEFVNAVLDAVIVIANGGSAGVPKMVETALAASIPLLIGLLASLLGVGGLANKIKQVFQKVSRPVNRAIDKIAAKIAQAAKKISKKFEAKFGNKKERELPAAIAKAQTIVRNHEMRKSPAIRLTAALGLLRVRYRWIRGFEVESTKPRTVWLLASKNKVHDDYEDGELGSTGGSKEKRDIEAARKRFFKRGSSTNCYYCRLPNAEAVDHFIARHRGGDNEETNLVPVCVHCNSSKRDRGIPKTPPRGYSGTWPPEWWTQDMKNEHARRYGPPGDWTLEEDESSHDSTRLEPRIPPGSQGGSTEGRHFSENKQRIFAGRQAVACMYCRKPRASAVEHVVPRVAGGDNEERNLGPSCALCNSSKGDSPAPKTPPYDYEGKWPPSWWPTGLQVWHVMEYGPPKTY
ncbi:HNH endonuclease [Streptomyces sp. NPDC059679]|uniref:HNH endonuclease n=1 Tax=Streptomyces sp. NPDC059679 TaxID=3346903 RepID=UPI00369F25BB